MPATIDTPQFNGPRPTWLWPLRIPFGKITLLAGDPGLGKSFIALDIAARLSTGTPMPHHAVIPPEQQKSSFDNLPPGDTLLLSAEDELHDTIFPRLRALNADTNRIHPFRCLDACRQHYEPFSLKTHLDELSIEIETSNAQLLILDPITAFMDGIDHNSTAHVRKYLTPLAQLAAFYNLAILAITHFSKETKRQSLYRATNSLALTAVARAFYVVHPSPGAGAVAGRKHNLFAPSKQNLNTPQPPLPFTIADNALQWLPLPSPDSPLTSQDTDPSTPDFYEHHDRQSAMQFLTDALKDGPKPSGPLIKEARQLLISERTLRRAKATLGIQAQKSQQTWYWQLPTTPPAT
jgi:archaellum biogenesis ATPase FlaH